MNIKLKNIRIKPVNSFKYLGRFIKQDMKCLKEIKARIVLAKESFNNKRKL